MPEKNQYIFRSGELFIQNNNTLPVELPHEFEQWIQDSMDLNLFGTDAHVVLLDGDGSKQAVEPDASWIRLRSVFAATDPALSALASSAARALGIINWHHATRFCSRCGAGLVDSTIEIARLCPDCKAIIYPRLSPAIIVAVEKDGKILLARHSARNQEVFSCLAGFLEHGETLEECVAREVYEEAHLEIQNIRYAGSQSWPFPDQFMIAFRADWKAGEIRVDPSELLEAQWFDKDHLPNTPMPGTVAWKLIHDVFSPLSKK
jgi:NAD+ diphosphatase